MADQNQETRILTSDKAEPLLPTPGALAQLDSRLNSRDPFVSWKVVDVQFPATANTDLVIRHNLRVEHPKDVHYRVIKQFTEGTVYESASAESKAWTSNYIVLRSDTPNWTGRLQLGVLNRMVDNLDVSEFDIPTEPPVDPECCVTFSDGIIDNCLLCQNYFQDWNRGEPPVALASSPYAAPPLGVDGLDSFYPEFRGATDLSFYEAIGPDDENAIGGTTTSSLMELLLGSWNANEGHYSVKMQLTTAWWDKVKAAHATVDTSIFKALALPLTSGAPDTVDGEAVLNVYSRMPSTDQSIDATLGVTYRTYDTSSTTGTELTDTTATLTGLNRPNTENKWVTFDVLWRCGTVIGNFDSVLTDGGLQVYMTIGSGTRSLMFELNPLDLVLRVPDSETSSTAFDGKANELNGLIFNNPPPLTNISIKAKANSLLPFFHVMDLNSGTGSGTGNVTGPVSSTDNAIVRWNGTAGDTIQDSGITVADGATGTLSGSNSGDVTLAGTPNYLTIAAQVITRALVNLASHVTGRLPYANLTASTAASKLLGRQSGSSGDWQEITLGTNLSMSSTTLNATGGNSFGTVSVSGQSDVVADAAPDTLTFAAGPGIAITTDASADSVTIATTGSGFSGGALAYTGQVDVVNTVTETDLFSYSVPANMLATGPIDLFLEGDLLNNKGSNGDITLKVKYGSTTLYADTGTFSSNASRIPWRLNISLGRTTSASAEYTGGTFFFGTQGGATTGIGDMAANGTEWGALGGTATENSATALTFKVTMTLSAADANFSFRVQHGYLSRGGAGNTTAVNAAGSEPASPISGDVNLANDMPILERYDGSAWQYFGPMAAFTKPIDANYSWGNQGGASVSTVGSIINLTGTAQTGNQLRYRYKSTPATPFTVTAAMSGIAEGAGSFGMIFRESGTGKSVLFRAINISSILNIIVASCTADSAGTISGISGALRVVGGLPVFPLWFRVGNNGTNVTFEISHNAGMTWTTIFSEAKNAHFTTAPDQVGFYCNTNVSTDLVPKVTLYSWKEA